MFFVAAKVVAKRNGDEIARPKKQMMGSILGNLGFSFPLRKAPELSPSIPVATVIPPNNNELLKQLV